MRTLEHYGFAYTIDAEAIVTVTMNMPGPVNAMNPDFQAACTLVVEQLERERGLRGVVWTSAKTTFVAGGDIKEMLTSDPSQRNLWLSGTTACTAMLRRLELLRVPVVAAVNGAALGGGLELCLACNYRIVVDVPQRILGLPEVGIGLFPGAGGVIRTIHLLGLAQGLPLSLGGKPVTPAEALALGLVDLLVPRIEDLGPAAKRWILANPDAWAQPWDRPDHRIPGGDIETPAVRNALASVHAETMRKTRGLMPAARAIVDLALQAVTVDFDAAMHLQNGMFVDVLLGPEAKNLLTANFIQLNMVSRGIGRPAGIDPRPAKRVVLVAPGVSGCAIGYAALRAGLSVCVVGAERAKIETRLTALAAADPLAPLTMASLLGGPTYVSVAENLSECDTVVVADDDGTGTIAPMPNAALILAAPMAMIDGTRRVGFGLARLGSASRVMELLPAPDAPDDVLAHAFDFAQQIGKWPIIVRGTGSYVDRLSAAYQDETVRLAAEGMASDAVAAAAWRLGMQSVGADAGGNATAAAPTDTEVRDRLLFRQVIEALTAVGEGTIGVPEANIASLHSFGAPAWTGGLVQFVNTYGLARFAERADELAGRYGQRFIPPPVLAARIAAGTSFQ